MGVLNLNLSRLMFSLLMLFTILMLPVVALGSSVNERRINEAENRVKDREIANVIYDSLNRFYLSHPIEHHPQIRLVSDLYIRYRITERSSTTVLFTYTEGNMKHNGLAELIKRNAEWQVLRSARSPQQIEKGISAVIMKASSSHLQRPSVIGGNVFDPRITRIRIVCKKGLSESISVNGNVFCKVLGRPNAVRLQGLDENNVCIKDLILK